MPWPAEHKAQTRASILGAAAAAIRERGPDGLAVADVMKRAGLTHGGFYAHFTSKDELLLAALEQASEESLAPLRTALGAAGEGDPLTAVLAAYLSPWHMERVAAGCPVAALAPELARSRGGLQRGLAQAIRARIDWLRRLMPDRRSAARRRDDAVGTLACMVGALEIARVLGGEEGQRTLAAARRFLGRALARGEHPPRG